MFMILKKYTILFRFWFPIKKIFLIIDIFFHDKLKNLYLFFDNFLFIISLFQKD